MRPQTYQRLKQAYELASNIMNSASSPEEALKKAGVGRGDIEAAKKYLNNPFSNLILEKVGGNKDAIVNDLDKVQSIFDTGYSNTEQAPVGELEALQKTLQRLK